MCKTDGQDQVLFLPLMMTSRKHLRHVITDEKAAVEPHFDFCKQHQEQQTLVSVFITEICSIKRNTNNSTQEESFDAFPIAKFLNLAEL